MWKTASASPSSGGRPRLVADHTHKEPCTKIARAGTCSFLPISQQRGVRFYLFIVCHVAPPAFGFLCLRFGFWYL